MHKAKNEILAFLKSLTGEDFSKGKTLEEIKAAFSEILKQEGVSDFFKSSVN